MFERIDPGARDEKTKHQLALFFGKYTNPRLFFANTPYLLNPHHPEEGSVLFTRTIAWRESKGRKHSGELRAEVCEESLMGKGRYGEIMPIPYMIVPKKSELEYKEKPAKKKRIAKYQQEDMDDVETVRKVLTSLSAQKTAHHINPQLVIDLEKKYDKEIQEEKNIFEQLRNPLLILVEELIMIYKRWPISYLLKKIDEYLNWLDRIQEKKIETFRGRIEAEYQCTPQNLRMKPPMFSEDGTQGMLIMRLVEGKNLQQLLIDRKNCKRPFSISELLLLFKNILFAVKNQVHDDSIEHRDLKLENIMVDDSFNATIIDFGLSMRKAHPRLTGGSPYYMAPERLRICFFADENENDSSDMNDLTKADIFALALVFKLMCGGQFSDASNVTKVLENNSNPTFSDLTFANVAVEDRTDIHSLDLIRCLLKNMACEKTSERFSAVQGIEAIEYIEKLRIEQIALCEMQALNEIPIGLIGPLSPLKPIITIAEPSPVKIHDSTTLRGYFEEYEPEQTLQLFEKGKAPLLFFGTAGSASSKMTESIEKQIEDMQKSIKNDASISTVQMICGR